MTQTVATYQPDWTSGFSASLDASDDFEALDEARYCPTGLLSAFVESMAANGRPVSMTSMLGDREYAMWQLARAHTMGDSQLRAIAAKLFDYFDDLDHARTAH